MLFQIQSHRLYSDREHFTKPLGICFKCILITRGGGSFRQHASLFHNIIRSQVAAILKTSEKSFDLYHINVQRQVGGSDCCLFAIAFAASLCARKDPHTKRYAQTEMRQHLTRCFEEKKITSFPNSWGRTRLGRHRILNRKKVDVFCVCRLP